MEKNTSKFNENFIKNYDKEYILGVDVVYLKRLQNLHNDLPFLPERMKIKKCSKFVCNWYDKNNYAAHIRTSKEVIQFNQKAWRKSYIDMNTKLRTEAKNDFEKDFLS